MGGITPGQRRHLPGLVRGLVRVFEVAKPQQHRNSGAVVTIGAGPLLRRGSGRAGGNASYERGGRRHRARGTAASAAAPRGPECCHLPPKPVPQRVAGLLQPDCRCGRDSGSRSGPPHRNWAVSSVETPL